MTPKAPVWTPRRTAICKTDSTSGAGPVRKQRSSISAIRGVERSSIHAGGDMKLAIMCSRPKLRRYRCRTHPCADGTWSYKIRWVLEEETEPGGTQCSKTRQIRKQSNEDWREGAEAAGKPAQPSGLQLADESDRRCFTQEDSCRRWRKFQSHWWKLVEKPLLCGTQGPVLCRSLAQSECFLDHLIFQPLLQRLQVPGSWDYLQADLYDYFTSLLYNTKESPESYVNQKDHTLVSL